MFLIMFNVKLISFDVSAIPSKDNYESETDEQATMIAEMLGMK